MIIWLIGISGAGKTTIGTLLRDKLTGLDKKVYLIDGDDVRSFFDNDLELFIIWSVIVLNKSVKMMKGENEKFNIEKWRSEIEKLNTQGINTMSLSEITGIPRPTVSRKIKKLLRRKLAIIDEYKLIHPETATNKKDLVNIQNISVSSFAKFSVTILNFLIFN